MSADTTKDVSLIQDEDVLRKMWQETEDFGRKKEIRSHMYKLREQRLREFYNNGEVSSEIRTSATTESKTCDKPTHADSLADHSFLSLKSKEIRDSESPTRDVNYKVTEKHNDQGWQIESSKERSADGKTHKTTRLATTSGSQKIDGGKIDFTAKSQQEASVYKDGDDKNFSKSVGAHSNTVIQQEATGGDANSNFKTSSTKTSSSSRVVTEHKSTSGDALQPLHDNMDQTTTVSRKVYTNDIPSDLRNHPSFVEGNTKVTRETKTLPDGTVVTTTRYETKGGSSSQTCTSTRYSTDNSSNKSEQLHSSKTTVNQKEIRDNSRAIEYINDQPEHTVRVTTDNVEQNKNSTYTNKNQDLVESKVNVIIEHTDHRDTKSQKVLDQQHTNQTIKQHYNTQDIKNQNFTAERVENIKIIEENYGNKDIRTDFSDDNVERKVSMLRENYDNKDVRNKQGHIEKKTSTIRENVQKHDIGNVGKSTEQIERQTKLRVEKQTTDDLDVCHKNIDERHIVNIVPVESIDANYTTIKTTTIKKEPVQKVSHTTITGTTTVHNKQHDSKYNRSVTNDKFINIERQHEKDTRDVKNAVEPKSKECSPVRKIQPIESKPEKYTKEQPEFVEHPQKRPVVSSPGRHPTSPERRPKEQTQNFEQPEKRQPIKPGKSELDVPTKPTDGQYETTYRTEFTNKKISVEVSPTHDAFARSLRAVTPERIPSKCSSPSRGSNRSLRTSTNSLRSSTSPEKIGQPSRYSPERERPERSTSPKKSTDRFTGPEMITSKSTRYSPDKKFPNKSPSPQRVVTTDKITKKIDNENVTVTRKSKTDSYSTDTVTRRNITTDSIDSNSITRRKTKPRSRSPSPISTIASDIEYIQNTDVIVTDLDDENIITTKSKTDTRPTSLEITTKKTKKITERSPTSPLTDLRSPKKSPTKDQLPKEIPRRSSLRSPSAELSPSEKPPKYFSPDDRPVKRTDTYEQRCRQILGITQVTDKRKNSLERSSVKRCSLVKDTLNETVRNQTSSPEKTPEMKSPVKDKVASGELPSRDIKSPRKEPIERSPEEKKSPTRKTPAVSEYPSQIRKSPEKKPLKKYPEKSSPTKNEPKISEFPSQIRKSPEKQCYGPYPEKKSPIKDISKITEYPSQVKKPSEREPTQHYPKKESPIKEIPQLKEFPSQSKSPEKQQIQPYPDKRPNDICEFSPQIRKTPEKELPERKIPYQLPKSPEKEYVELCLEYKTATKDTSKIAEFPSQTRKVSEKEPLVGSEHPSQIPDVCEFPTHIKERTEPYPEKKSPTRSAPNLKEENDLKHYPEVENLSDETEQFPAQVIKLPNKELTEFCPDNRVSSKVKPSVEEFPSQVRKSLQKEPLGPYPEKKVPQKTKQTLEEFPSQVRKSPQKEPLEPYPQKEIPQKIKPSVEEFPSQKRKSPQKEVLEPYPEKKVSPKAKPSIQEFPSQVRKSTQKEPLEFCPEKKIPEKTKPSIQEFPSQLRKSPQKEPPETCEEKKVPQKYKLTVQEFPAQIRKTPQKSYTEKKSPTKESLIVSDKTPTEKALLSEKTPSGNYPCEKLQPQIQQIPTPVKKTKVIKDHPSALSESSSEDETEINEVFTETNTTYLQNKIPVNEPKVTKKFISALCREDEVEKTNVTKKNTLELLEQEIKENELTETLHKTVKKDQPIGQPRKQTPVKTRYEEFIKTERSNNTVTISGQESPREKPLTKRPTIEKPTERKPNKTVIKVTKTQTPKSPAGKQQEIHRVEKTKFIDQTEYKNEYKNKIKATPKETRKSKKPDVESVSDTEEENTIRIKKHKIDNITKKTTTTKFLVSEDLMKKTKPKDFPKQSFIIPKPTSKPAVSPQVSPSRRPMQSKQEEPKLKPTTQTKYTTTVKKTINVTDHITVPKTSKNIGTTIVRKIINVTSPSVRTKPTKPEELIHKKHLITTTITVPPKAKPVTSKPITKTITTKTKLVHPTSKSPKPEKLQNGHISSDTENENESIIDSLEGSTVDLTAEKITTERSDTKITRISSGKTTVREESPAKRYPDKTKKSEKKCITTKTVIINNKDAQEREIIVDLQRSKSSREPTPDRLCPIPISSDEELGIPRYPDEVIEPEYVSFKPKSKVSDIPIPESEDTTEFTRISEITNKSKITEVDKVEESDESLLSVNKKISKFLDTADKLTKEPLKPTGSLTKTTRPHLQVAEEIKSDESLLSVSDKVNKFITTAEQLFTPKHLPDRPKSPRCQYYHESTDEPTGKVSEKVSQFINTANEISQPRRPSEGPAPKVERPDLSNVDDTLKEDECLLSVSDKVSKFISTADKLTSTDLKKPVSLAKIDVKTKNEPSRKSPERISLERLSPERISPERISSVRISPERISPGRKIPSRFTPTEYVQTETEEHTYIHKSSLSPTRYSPRRNESPKLEKTPVRRPSNYLTNITKTDVQETKYAQRDSSPKLTDTTPKSGRRPSHEEPKQILSPTGRLRSTESIKKAKALFESINKEQCIKQRDILSRPSVFEGKNTRQPEDYDKSMPKEKITVLRKRLSYSDEENDESNVTTLISKTKVTTSEDDCLKSTKMVLDKMRSTSRTPERDSRPSKSPDKVPEISTAKPTDRESSSEYGDIPHYMLPLDRSLRPNSPHRENISHAILPSHQPVQSLERDEPRDAKFGVTLRRTDSGKATATTTSITTTSSERRKSSITLEKRITEEEIEDIFELEILEELLEKVMGYDLRRKIRAQIRLVKKLITENKLSSYVTKRVDTILDTKRETSPSKGKSHPSREEVKKITEYQTKYTKKTSPERKITDSKHYQHTLNKKENIEKTTEHQSSYTYSEKHASSNYTIKGIRRSESPDIPPVRAISPEKSSTLRTTSPIRKSEDKKGFTGLNKTTPLVKAVADEKPEWVKQRNLRKTTENSIPVGKKITTTTTSTTTRRENIRSSSPVKDPKPTDLITSSYGVGPTDENGTPLFGLKALRAQKKTDTTKVQGTVIRSEYYSEDGKEPVGQVSVTKYSTDPRDVGTDEGIVNNKGIRSVTTTQKFGYKDTPSLKTLTNKKKEISNVDDSVTSTTKSSKVTRRNSVKALSQKFIDNAVDTLKSERQTSYPKAGLILRTSSFKDSGSGTDDSREVSPVNRECESTVTMSTTTTRTVGGDTFLTNKSRVSGVKDVIDRMKTEDYQEGDTEEDAAARGLLNKFIGSQVILSGMESRTSSSKTTTVSPSSTVKRTTKITTTVTEGGKPITKTCVYQHPITEGELETIWDEETLRLLLEQSTDYEERRLVRARLRQVMAEQEACTELVEKASQEQSGGTIEGESLLLPLLQGLLEAPENDQTADSGTESGEDQRSGLIAEVQNALDKLSASLRSDSTDITPERRCSLLHLVTKLQAGLATTTPKLERRLSSGPGRFNRRKQRQNRHTVGVSSEELADARRLMEEISLHELTPSQSENKVTDLQKQNSESSVTSNSSSFNKFGNKTTVKNATAKPFNSSSNSISNTSSSVHTPTEPSEHLDLLFNEESTYHESAPVLTLDKKPSYAVKQSSSVTSLEQVDISDKRAPLSNSVSLDLSQEIDIKSVQQAVKQAAARKKKTSETVETETEEEDDTSTVKEPKENAQTPPPSSSPSLHENPIYTKPEENKQFSSMSYEEKCNRFNTQLKKNKMKRANTIDIPKSVNYYEDEIDSEYSEDESKQRKNNYIALRGPIRVRNPMNRSSMPVFEPKTESDQKFLAFINKNNSENVNKGSLWSGQSSKTPVCGSKFGNIRNNFEKASSGASNNSARNFWKTADDAITAGSVTQFGPKISRRSARNLQQMFEEKQKQSQEQITAADEGNIVTGSLKLKTEPEKSYKFVPQPLPVNQFSHAPQSAFKPIPKKIATKPETLAIEPKQEILKTEIKETKSEAPLFLYSPKPLFHSQNNSVTSPVTSKPWIVNATEHGGRVLSMAAKKFEVPSQQETFSIKPRKLSKDINKVFIPQETPPEKLTAPYLVKNAEQKSNTVRKLSGQYDNLNTQTPEYSSHATVKYQPAQEKRHYVPNYNVPQNMSYPHKKDSGSTYQTNVAYPQPVTQQIVQPTQQQQFVPKTPQSPLQTYNTQYQTPQSPRGYGQQFHYQPQNYSVRYDQQPQTTHHNYQQKFNQLQEFKPVNYSITYDKPKSVITPQHIPEKQQNYPNLPAQQTFQHVPGRETDPPQTPKEYTSTYQFIPQKPKQPPQAQPQDLEPPGVHPPKLETQLSSESVHEYTAINSKVMTGPVSQQAVTIHQNSPKSRAEHDIEAAFNLRNALQKVNKTEVQPVKKSPTNSFKYKASERQQVSPNNSFQYKSREPPQVPQNNSFKYKANEPQSPKNYSKYNPRDIPKPTIEPSSFKVKNSAQESVAPSENKTFGVVKPIQQKLKISNPIFNNVTDKVPKPRSQESLEINEKGQSVVTSKFHIPVINVASPTSPNPPSPAKVLSKSDSWHQICMANQTSNKSSPRASPVARTIVKSKSSNTLAVPQKQFEAGMSKEELIQKKKTMEAYFAGGNKLPQSSESGKHDTKVVKRSINRIKTSEKLSTYRQSSGLSRSRTLPDIVCPQLLDESNVDKAFDDLFKSNS